MKPLTPQSSRQRATSEVKKNIICLCRLIKSSPDIIVVVTMVRGGQTFCKNNNNNNNKPYNSWMLYIHATDLVNTMPLADAGI